MLTPSADQERGGPFGDHHRRQMSVRAANYRDDGRVDDGETFAADEPAARIDDRRRIVGGALQQTLESKRSCVSNRHG